MTYITDFFNSFLYSLIVPIFVIGVGCIVVSMFVPSLLPQYKFPLKTGGAILILAGTFLCGKYTEHANIVALQEKNKIILVEKKALQEKSSVSIITKYINKTNTIEKIKYEPITLYVDKKADESCPIDATTSDDIGRLLNASAKGTLVSPTNSDGTTARTK
jgi:hypothetical protein